jgi:Family of unknown function (DUF6282)
MSAVRMSAVRRCGTARLAAAMLTGIVAVAAASAQVPTEQAPTGQEPTDQARGAQTSNDQPRTFTHWEAYKNWKPAPSVDQHLRDRVLEGGIDLHAHFGPDSYPRQWDAFEVVALAQERGMRAIVLKNHWSETAGLAWLVRKYGAQGIEVFGGLALDSPVGGVNPQAVRYFVDVEGGYGRIVWMPTHDAEHEVKTLGQNRPFVRVSENGKLLPETLEVIGLIAEHGLILATGHVTPGEALAIMREARRAGVERLIVTHPALGPEYTYMSDAELHEAVDLGGFIEIVAGSLTRGGEGREHNVHVIRTVGAEHAFVGSDSGLTGSPNHPDALAMAAGILREEGFSEAELDLMFKTNPAWLLGLEEE